MCGWLHEQGLGLYVAQCQSWIKSGQTLLQASQHEVEKVRPEQTVANDVDGTRSSFTRFLTFFLPFGKLQI